MSHPGPSEFRTPCSSIPVLVVDDDEVFRSALQEVLAGDHHPVVALPDPHSVVRPKRLKEGTVVVTDVGLPGEDGMGLAGRIHQQRPELPIVLLTGYSVREISHGLRLTSYVVALNKVVEYDQLHRLIHDLADAAAARAKPTPPL